MNWAPLTVVGLLVVGAAVGGEQCCVNGCGSGYSKGDRAGQVTKLSRKGLILKSWEGELNLGGAAAGAQTNTWDFSVRDESLIAPLVQAMESGKRVRLTYRQWLLSPITVETDYQVIAAAVQP